MKLKLVEEIIRDPNSTSKEIHEAKEFLFRRINKKLNIEIENSINKNQLNCITNSELNQTIQTPLVEALVEKDKIVSNWCRMKKNLIQASFPLVFSDNQKNPVLIDTKFEINNEKMDIDEDISLSLSKNHSFPFQWTMFNESNFDIEHEFNYQTDNFLTYSPKLYFKNFLYNRTLSLLVNPSVNYDDRLSLSEFNIGVNSVSQNKQFITNSKICPITKALNSTLIYRPKNDEKIVANLSYSNKSLTIATVFHKIMSKYHSHSFSFIMRNGLISLGNDFIIHKSSSLIELKSNLNIIKQKDSLMLNSIFSVVFKIYRFKITIPIIISSVNNPYTLISFGLSTIIGNSILFLINTYRSHFKNRNRILEQKSLDKQIKFNENNKNETDIITEEQKRANGLIINYSYLGEKDKIQEIYKNISIFGKYRNEDKNVFDIRPALILTIHEGKLILPKNILELNGVYSPTINNHDNLYYLISYKYSNLENTIVIKNGRVLVELP